VGEGPRTKGEGLMTNVGGRRGADVCEGGAGCAGGGWVLGGVMLPKPWLKKPLVDGIRAIAVFEAAKGLRVLGAGLGLLSLVHRNAAALAERLVHFSHLNPASKYPHIFIDAAASVTDARLWMLAAGAGVYAIVRLAEAYGLWRGRPWAEWLALVGGALYVPVELYHLRLHFTGLKIAVLAANLGVVGYMVYALRNRARTERELADASALV
jgi:uncharacterized membrane protein (DUF2068 family)